MRAALAFGLALLAATPLAIADDDPTAPPADIAPASITLKRLLALHADAVGAIAPGTAHTRIETWAYEDGKLSGTQSSVASGKDYREDITLGPFHSARGQLGGKDWEQNRNGLTRMLSGIHRREGVNEYALAHALAPNSGVTLLGEVTSPVRAFVVKDAPKNGLVEYLFYDASTFLLVRDESAVEGRRIVYTYDDFRSTNGFRQPWHIHRINGFKDNQSDWKLQSLTIGAAVDPSKLAIPQSANPVELHAGRVSLPAKMSGDRIIVTVQLGAHKVNLQMDSGASEILLNSAVADATGVQSFGRRTETTAGQYLASDALIPEIDFGGAAMRNVAAQTAPYGQSSYGDVPVAGLMGYDFIAGAVIHVDYFNGTVEAIAPDAFTAPPGAIALPIRLDDGVPIVDVRIGSATGHAFIVDTGADRSMIFSGFANAHASDLVDQGLGQSMTASFPFIGDVLGVGGKVEARPVQVSSLGLGSITLPDWLFEVSQNAPSFEGDDYDGLIGQDVLRNFDVYFDYSRSTIYMLPNERYRERWGS